MIAFIIFMVALMLYIIYQLHSRLTKVEKALSFQIKLSNLQSGLLTILLKEKNMPSEENTEE